MTRNDVRRRALRAAVAVTLGTTMLGCATTVVDTGDSTEDGSGAVTTHETHATTGSSSVTLPTATGSGGSDQGGGGAAQAGGGATATTTTASAGGADPDAMKCTTLRNSSDWDAYSKCCDAVNWSPAAGCEAWGPPMPPSMDWMLEVMS